MNKKEKGFFHTLVDELIASNSEDEKENKD